MIPEGFQKAKLQELFYESYNSLSEDEILEINKKNPTADINNVIVGLCKHCFGIAVNEIGEELSFQLCYINGSDKLEGDALQLSLNSLYRDYLIFYFSGFLAHHYDDLDEIDVYNTFQNQMRSMLERFGYITVDSNTIDKFRNPTIIAAGVRGIIKVNFIDRLSLYRDLFSKFGIGISNEKNLDYVYLMLNKRNNYIKIGRSKNPSHREKTLQSDEPDIELIVAWAGTPIMEKELHRLFHKKRKRGEWFNLQLNDIKIICEYIQVHETRFV
jgi:Meiotically up-regulated gene 113